MLFAFLLYYILNKDCSQPIALPMPEEFETKLAAYGAVVFAVADKEAYGDNTRGKAIAKF